MPGAPVPRDGGDMASTTVHHHVPTDDEADLAARERLRSVVPVLVSVVALLGVTLVLGLVLREMLDFGIWLISVQ